MKEFLNQKQKSLLLGIARKTLTRYIKKGEIYQPRVEDSGLKTMLGLFVSLHNGSNLRGCLGSLAARSPLYLELRDMVIAAASRNGRFLPVKEEELSSIKIEVSVLSPLKKVKGTDEIILGRHGVLVERGHLSGVFLPQVAKETGPDKENFMKNLCLLKAGFSDDVYNNGDYDIFIFEAEVFSE